MLCVCELKVTCFQPTSKSFGIAAPMLTLLTESHSFCCDGDFQFFRRRNVVFGIIGVGFGGVASDGVERVVMKKHRLFNFSSCSPNSDYNVEKELSKRNTR